MRGREDMEARSVPRLRRSELSSPASNSDMMRKALTKLTCDEVFLDLEDSVASNQKEKARENVVKTLQDVTIHPTKTVAVRINNVRTEHWVKDVTSTVRGAGEFIDCILIPKVEAAQEVKAVAELLAKLEQELRLEKRIGLEAQIETARGLMSVTDIAFSSDRLESLIWGAGDYAASVGIPSMTIGGAVKEYPGHIWHHAMAEIRNASAAAGLQAIDGPYAALTDLKGFEESARLARSMGYDGKWVIHPSQIEPCHRAFTPTAEEIAEAKLVVEEYGKALEEGRGAIMLGGVMVDAATLRIATRVIEMAKILKIV